MEITSDWLKSNSPIRKELDDEIKKILYLLKDTILISNRNGYTHIKFLLPGIFPLIQLDNDLCRLYIHSQLLKKLINNGFEVILFQNTKKNKYSLNISWASHFSTKEIDEMNNIINKYGTNNNY